MEGTKDVVTRSHSPLDNYVPMNNQRKPTVGEIIRTRIHADRQHNNIQTHGWVTIRVEECHEIEPKDEEGKDYVIKGTIINTGKPLLTRLKWRCTDDTIDYRCRQGWDIAVNFQNPDDDDKHNQRLTNSQHIDNKSVPQIILTEEEFRNCATCTLQGYVTMSSQVPQNLYETPRPNPIPIGTSRNHEEEPETPTSRPRVTRRIISPSAPRSPNLSLSDSVGLSDTSRSEGDSESLIWEINDHEYTTMLGKSIEDNLITITNGYDKKLIKNINSLSQAITSEKKLVMQTNNMQDQLRTISWTNNPIEINKYVKQRRKWYTIASKYKTDRDRVLHGIEQNTEDTLNLPGLGENTKMLLRDLENSIESNQFISMLKQISERMIQLDENIDQHESEHSEHLQSMVSLFDFEDLTPCMADNVVAQFSDDELHIGKLNKLGLGGSNTIQIKEHPALKDLGKHDPRRNTDLTVFMTDGVENGQNNNTTIPKGLTDLLYYEAVDLVDDAKNILLNITKSITDISDASPNKHTEETLRDYERKAERISEKKIVISNKYADYVMRYPVT